MATIKEVALRAKVSTATVSRVLNDNYPTSQEAREKVFAAIKELGYRPNAVARSLKMNKTFMIGMVVPDISNIFFMEIARGVESIISQLGYTMIFCSTDENPEKELKLLKALNEKRVDYVILASSMQDSSKLNRLIDEGLNIIMIDTIVSGVKADSIVEENYSASYKLITHAIELGHRDFGIVNGIMEVSTARERYEGFKQALQDHGLKENHHFIIEGSYNRKQAYTNSLKQLQDYRDCLPSIFFSTNNEMTEGLMIALNEVGVQIPKEVSLVSYGDITVPKLILPHLTYVEQDARAIGVKAGEVLIASLDDSTEITQYQTYIIPSKIVVQDSVTSSHKS
jgi:DNA-binding LacI/PurR family transcriptional regulator